MRDLLGRVEDRRLALGLSQRAVAERLSISQPHYSKVVGGIVQLTPTMAEAMAAWLDSAGAPRIGRNRRLSRVRALTRLIERQLRELNALLAEDGVEGGRRAPRPTRRK